jgi:hypothetical protein
VFIVIAVVFSVTMFEQILPLEMGVFSVPESTRSMEVREHIVRAVGARETYAGTRVVLNADQYVFLAVHALAEEQHLNNQATE